MIQFSISVPGLGWVNQRSTFAPHVTPARALEIQQECEYRAGFPCHIMVATEAGEDAMMEG